MNSKPMVPTITEVRSKRVGLHENHRVFALDSKGRVVDAGLVYWSEVAKAWQPITNKFKFPPAHREVRLAVNELAANAATQS
jgi:hypothetical protein